MRDEAKHGDGGSRPDQGVIDYPAIHASHVHIYSVVTSDDFYVRWRDPSVRQFVLSLLK